MSQQAKLVVGILTFISAIVGTTLAFDSRYAKSEVVEQKLDENYSKMLKLRLLEINLKEQQSPADEALKQYIKQELAPNE